MPFPDPNVAARAGAPFLAKKGYANWREEGDALAARLESHEREVVRKLLHPEEPTDSYAYRDNTGKVALVSPSSEHVFVPEAEAQSYVNNGWLPETPTAYWARQQQEARQREIKGAGFEAFAKGAVSGLTFGASDMLERYGSGSMVLRDMPDGSVDLWGTGGGWSDLERAQAIQEEHSGKATLGAIAGSTVSLFYGGAASVAARAGRAIGRTGAKVLGFTGSAERAAALATEAAQKAAGKSIADELALYKNLPKTNVEKEALRLELAKADLGKATEEAVARTATLAEKTAALEGAAAPAETTALVRWSEAPLATMSSERAGLYEVLRASTGPTSAAEREALGLAADRLKTTKDMAAALERVGLPEAEKGLALKALKLERDLHSKQKWWDDTIGALDARLKRQDPTVTASQAKQVRRWEHDWSRIVDGLSDLAARRGVAGHRPEAKSVMDEILGSFFDAPRAPRALPAAKGAMVEEAQAAAKEAVSAVERAASKAEIKKTLEAELKAAQEAGRMPDFLRARASAPLGPTAAPYTQAAGEAWLAGQGAQKTSSRFTPGERWDPGAWSTGKASPSFPGEAAPVAPSTRAQDILSTMGTAATRGAIEGGTYAGGRELSRQALGGEEYDPGAVAAHAVEGAALGSLVSLAGAGISSVAGRATQGLSRAVASKAGVDTTRLEIMLARERIIKARLEHLYESPTRAAHAAALKNLQADIFNARAQVFQAGGELLKSMSIPLGAASGIGSGSLVGMLLGHAGAHGAARILSSGIVKRAGVAVGRAALATGRALPMQTMGTMTKLAIVGALTAEDVDALKGQLDNTDPSDVGMAAAQGYQAAGIDPGMTKFLADFQSRRVHVLKLAVDNAGKSSTGRVVAGRVYDAVEDPRRITQRLSSGDVRNEDLLVMQNLFPSFYQDMSRQAVQLLKRRGLSTRQRLDLMKIAGNATYPITTNAIQTALVPQQKEEQPGRRSVKITNDAATESQRIQGGM